MRRRQPVLALHESLTVTLKYLRRNESRRISPEITPVSLPTISRAISADHDLGGRMDQRSNPDPTPGEAPINARLPGGPPRGFALPRLHLCRVANAAAIHP